MPNAALQYVSRFVTLTSEEEALFLQHLQMISCAPRQVLTGIGDLEQHVYFIRKGVVRKYFYQGTEEITLQLSMEGEVVSSTSSFLSGTPSDYVLEVMESSVLAFLTKSSLELLYDFSFNFEKMGRLIALEGMLYREKWDMTRMVKTPRERFELLLEEKPGILERVPQKYIASMLNMKPETLSRHKKMIRN